MTDYIIDDEDIGCLKDYFYAIINGEDNLPRLKELFEQEIGIIRSNPLSDHDAEIRNKVMDEFGILHGEDAKRLHDYMNDPNPPMTEVSKELIREAMNRVDSDTKRHDADLKCITCGGIVTSPKCDRCYANNIDNIKEEISKKERERVLNKFESRIREIPQTHFASVMEIIETLRGEP